MPSSPLVILFFAGWAQILVYGSNTVLFATGMYLLGKRKAREGTLFQVISSVILFALATVSAVVGTVLVAAGYASITAPTAADLKVCSIIQYVVLCLIDFTAASVLIFRCFNIWSRDWKVIAVPVVTILVATGVYYAGLPQYIQIQYATGLQKQASGNVLQKSLGFTTAALVLAAFSNALLTLLIAGRIWWLKRQLKGVLSRGRGISGITGNLPQKYDSVIAITMESGIIIPIFQVIFLVYMVLNASSVDHDALTIMASMLPQVIAFAPLLIMVRVGLGVTVEGDHDARTSVDIIERHRPVDLELDSVSGTKGLAL
ncbi:hypothetical protein V5O48_011895 [Marasmius crinis-equi]|uniref:Uncharacterized protein n=1 Tax=Marasmius crinis-equi TaxID=585013 RepID=A0ABR3F4C8_9AGAR